MSRTAKKKEPQRKTIFAALALPLSFILLKKYNMKRMMFLVASAVALSGAAQAQSKESGGKILIAYFSWGGNTREMAKQIQQQTGGDLFEITTVKTYSKDYNECVAEAKKEQQANARPPLANEVKNMADYDVVFVGYPNWWGTMPQALFTFLEKYDLSGKTVVPFCTHGGGRWGRSLDDLKKLCPESKILEGLAIGGSMVRRSKDDVVKWLQKIGITKNNE
ncbi:MAG: NAD(P)H-dependent oxidoreductase [Prevotellaceae bacterium]|nr:NAD(P)H-dependent oxidoreductase [Prevotellaceae bacterium]